jgi:cytochrome c oxidase cbb3-type subunit I
MLYIVGKWPTYSGVESAAANWFFAHNVLGFWLTAMSLGGAYYFIPKVLGRPVYSYQLSVVGFWSLVMFYSLNGMHHLVGGPLPTWMITTSIVASVFMFIPVVATAINLHMTVVGRFGALRYSPTLRFVVIGSLAYTAVSLQGSFTALREVNRVTHFTHWTVAHSHVGGYAFVTFLAFGAMYYIVPRLVGREWPSERLIRWHFNLVLAGSRCTSSRCRGRACCRGWRCSIPHAVRGVGAPDAARPVGSHAGRLILTVGHVVFAYHFWLMVRRPDAAQRTRPPFHEARPVLYTAEAEAGRR